MYLNILLFEMFRDQQINYPWLFSGPPTSSLPNSDRQTHTTLVMHVPTRVDVIVFNVCVCRHLLFDESLAVELVGLCYCCLERSKNDWFKMWGGFEAQLNNQSLIVCVCVRLLVMVLVSFGGHYYGVVIGQLIVETWPDRLKNMSKINMKSCIIAFFLGEVNAS